MFSIAGRRLGGGRSRDNIEGGLEMRMLSAAVLLCAAISAAGAADLAIPIGGATGNGEPASWGRLESDRRVPPEGHQPHGRAIPGQTPGPAAAAWHRKVKVRYEPSEDAFASQVDACVAARQCLASATARRLTIVTDADLSRPAAARRQRVYVKTPCDVAATLE